MNKKLIYLDTYVLQRDMRIRLPKSVLENLDLVKGLSKFDIYLDSIERTLILKIVNDEREKLIDEKLYK